MTTPGRTPAQLVVNELLGLADGVDPVVRTAPPQPGAREPLTRSGWRDAGTAAVLRELADEVADMARSAGRDGEGALLGRSVQAHLLGRQVEEEAMADASLAALTAGELESEDRAVARSWSAYLLGRAEGARLARQKAHDLLG